MKVLRKQEIETKDIRIGDQISINLSGLGEFTATAQKITDDGVLFMFDDCVAERCMNDTWTNDGGYAKSDLHGWMKTVLMAAFPTGIKERITDLTIPTYGQIFGHDDYYKSCFMPDEDERLPLMTKRKNRVADFNDDYEWYWLQNATKCDVSATSFANVYYNGAANFNYASYSRGVRPVFTLLVN